MCARSSPAGPAKRSRSRRRPRIQLRADAPERGFWPTSCSPNTACICRSIVRARPMRAKGIDLDVSTLADWVGACAATLMPGQDGHYPAIAYQVAFHLILALQAAALAWFAFSRVRERLLTLVSAFRHRALQRAQIAPRSTTPRLHLATGWGQLNSV